MSEPHSFCFLVALWGEPYRHRFLERLLPSLLAPGNIPAIPGKIREQSRFLIATTSEDWSEIVSHHNFCRLQQYVRAVKCDVPDGPTPIVRSARAIKLMAITAHGFGACGVFLTPDLMVSDHTITEVRKLYDRGVRAVLFPVTRFDEAKVERWLAGTSVSCEMTAAGMARMAVNCFHKEMLAYEWSSNYAPEVAAIYWKRLRDGGVLIHNACSWFPVMIDFSALPEHDASAFDTHHFDGAYIWRNIKGLDTEFILDWSRIFVISTTPGHQGAQFEPIPKVLSLIPGIGRLYHAHALRRTLLFTRPGGYLQGCDPNVLYRAAIWASDLNTPPLPVRRHAEKKSVWPLACSAAVLHLAHRSVHLMHLLMDYRRVISLALSGDETERRRISARLRKIGKSLAGQTQL